MQLFETVIATSLFHFASLYLLARPQCLFAPTQPNRRLEQPLALHFSRCPDFLFDPVMNPLAWFFINSL
jgi:hypothetical protein